ncbi:MAG: pyruvate, phosphate dikinase [Polyangiales bacterium]
MSKYVYSFGQGKTEGDPKRKDLLGGKGAGLAEMTSLGLPVPPGFTLTTEVCTAYHRGGKHPDGLEGQVKEALGKLEGELGMNFGDPERPLLVSVRSGARASMPGMMDTILNLGLNDETVQGMAKRTDNLRFAYDAYRRFITMYSGVALGVKKEHFDHALDEVRKEVAKERGIVVPRFNAEMLQRAVPDSDIPAEKLERVVAAFKEIVKKETGKEFPQNPEDQLWGAIDAVFSSWNNPRAIFYRKMHDIPDSWGTACNVQAMVFGNLGDTSATGVAFTRNPSTGEKLLYGEWLPNAQGEDVVAGIRTPRPILKSHAAEGQSLEEGMPECFASLNEIATKLENHFRDMQDLEFTIQEGKLYMLQCRTGKRTARAALRIACELVREGRIQKDEAVLRVEPGSLDQLLHPTLDPAAEKILLAKGLAASPGAASGHIVFHADEAEKKASQGVPVILVRLETSPEDIHGMKAARGILTARGGMTSHAAVVARGMGKPCVAGCPAISIDYAKEQMTIAVEGTDRTVVLKKGDPLTIEGGTGSVFEGIVPTVPAGLSGDFQELMDWADAYRTMKVRANADTPIDARTARRFGAEGIGLCRTEHMFFDENRIAAMREMILSETKEQRERALAKLLPYQREDFVGIFREMEGLPVTIRLLDPPLHEFLPNEPKQIAELSRTMGISETKLEERARDLHEFNPMLGHRGCRLAITYPEIYAMQVRAILEAAQKVHDEGKSVLPEIMIPLALSKAELDKMKEIVDQVSKEVFASGRPVDFLFGTMIELPRAALRAAELAQTAEFFSFGTNDLTQATLGLSRDDAGKFLPAYVESNILPKDPFVSIDQDGVGELVRLGRERGRSTREKLKVGVCGEHGGDPASIEFFQGAGLDYVSCSPFRVPIARLAAAQAGLRAGGKQGSSGTA